MPCSNLPSMDSDAPVFDASATPLKDLTTWQFHGTPPPHHPHLNQPLCTDRIPLEWPRRSAGLVSTLSELNSGSNAQRRGQTRDRPKEGSAAGLPRAAKAKPDAPPEMTASALDVPSAAAGVGARRVPFADGSSGAGLAPGLVPRESTGRHRMRGSNVN